jgi:hypothetical protein
MATLEVESMFVQSIENTASSAAVALTGGTRMESRRYANRPPIPADRLFGAARLTPSGPPFGRYPSSSSRSAGSATRPDEIFGDAPFHETDSNRAGALSLRFSTYVRPGHPGGRTGHPEGKDSPPRRAGHCSAELRFRGNACPLGSNTVQEIEQVLEVNLLVVPHA